MTAGGKRNKVPFHGRGWPIRGFEIGRHNTYTYERVVLGRRREFIDNLPIRFPARGLPAWAENRILHLQITKSAKPVDQYYNS